jgi:hypothetical protein
MWDANNEERRGKEKSIVQVPNTGVPKKKSLIYCRILIKMVMNRLQKGLINSRIALRASRLNCQKKMFLNGNT